MCDRLIVSIMSGKLSFHDWKSQGILLQKTCKNTVIRSVTYHVHIMRSHIATCHSWRHPALTSARQAGTLFTYRREMEGWLDISVGYTPRRFTCLQSPIEVVTTQRPDQDVVPQLVVAYDLSNKFKPWGIVLSNYLQTGWQKNGGPSKL